MKRLVPALLTLLLAGAAPAAPWKPEKGARYEIYLCAGQSNMDGRAGNAALTGALADYRRPQPDVLIRYSSGGYRRKRRASSGFVALRPGCNEFPGMFGPELSFGRALADARKGRKILLLKVSEGGTDLHSDWNPAAPNKLYARLIRLALETQALLKNEGATGEMAGMIWMQGESDSDTGQAERYRERLTAFIARIRADLNVEKMPFVIGQVCADNPSYQQVIAAQKAVAESVPATGLASSAGLTTSDKNVHFDAPSQLELGRRFAAELQELLAQRN